METSAKTAANVMDIFTSIAKKLPKSGDGSQGPGGDGSGRSAGARTPGAVNVGANANGANAGASGSKCGCN